MEYFNINIFKPLNIKKLEIDKVDEKQKIEAKYDNVIWALLTNHIHSPTNFCNEALKELKYLISINKNLTLNQAYYIFIIDFIKRSKKDNERDKLKNFSKEQILNFIESSSGDFSLILYMILYLSEGSVRDTIFSDWNEIRVFLDLIYYKVIDFENPEIITMDTEMRYLFGKTHILTCESW